jgi:Zn-dependent peptidase ImmA (M78 family)
MRPHMWDPWRALVSEPSITLVRADLPPGERGRYYPDRDVIVLAKGLLKVEERCTVAHELAHRRLGHTSCADRLSLVRQEREAEVVAARWLIDLHDLARAEQWGRAGCEVADELGVDVAMLLARREGLTRDERDYIDTCLRARDEGAA